MSSRPGAPTTQTHPSAANQTPLSGFDPIKDETLFQKLIDLISKIQTRFRSATTTTTTTTTNNEEGGITTLNDPAAAATTTKRQVETLEEDVRYIRENIEHLRNSPNSIRAEELLQYLMDAARHRSDADFAPNSVNLKQLLLIIAKLKLWIPRKGAVGSEELETAKKKRESPFVSSKEKENAAAEVIKELVGLKCHQWGMAGLLTSYQSLTDTQKLCLLCFSAFPCEVDKDKETGVAVEKSLVIKKKILIYLWVGERFIDLNPESKPKSESDHNPNPNVTPNLNPDSTPILNPEETPPPNLNPDPNPEENPNPDLNLEQNPDSDTNPNTITSTDAAGERREANHVSVHVSEKGKTIEEIGEQILKVLTEKGFIEPVMKKGQESGSCIMHPFVHSFVSALAKRAGFFEFSKEDGELTPVLGRSRRACLVKSQEKYPSSCQLWANWANDINSRSKLKRFQLIQTLFNVNEAIIDIKPECFSKMKYLSVLHLGSWRSGSVEHIEVEDQKFLEDLKNMEQLRLFSLQGVSTIMQLPDSVCELKNLIILDLKECHNLEELPSCIGALTSLTHLDITNCHLLTKLPRGISSLLNLEVLRGFVISDQAGDPQEKKTCIGRSWRKTKGCVLHDVLRFKRVEVCTLKDLMKLEKLRELSVVVNREQFPDSEEVKVFKEMNCLRKLKISWERSFKNEVKSAANQGSNQAPTESSIGTLANADQGNNEAPKESSSTCASCLLFKKPASENSRAVEAGPEEPKASKCLNLKCWKGQPTQEKEEEISSGESLEQIEKLELWCFPRKAAPEWLASDQLKGLKKLYIKGGNLETLPRVSGENKWNVTTLRLKYLPNLVIKWTALKAMFPEMTYLEKYDCKKLFFFPCDQEGVWRKK